MLRNNKLYLDETYKKECENKINYAKSYLNTTKGTENALVNTANSTYASSETSVDLLKPIVKNTNIKRKL